MRYLLNRLNEPSTWRGLIMILTALGLNISPELSEAILAGGVGLTGIIGAVTKD